MSDITAELTKKLATRVAKEIDLDAMAKKLAPTIAKEMERGLLQKVGRYDWNGALDSIMSNPRLWKSFETYMVSEFMRGIEGLGKRK